MTRKRTLTAAAIAALALVAVLLLQAIASSLPLVDTTAGGLMTPSKEASEAVRGIAIPMTLYLVAAEGTEEAYLQALLMNLAALNAKITYERVLPSDPRLAAYSETALADNSVLAVTSQRFAIVLQTALYEVDTAYDYYSGSTYYTDMRFAAEDRVVRAMVYASAQIPKAYILSGHDEPAISASLRGALQDAMVGLETLALTALEAVPEDAALVIINAPTKDLSEDEITRLEAYLANGGNLLVTTDCTISPLPRLSALLADYGMAAEPGIVLEGDSKQYIQTYKQYLLPTLSDHESVQAAAFEGLSVTAPMAHAISQLPDTKEGLTVSPLLTTSSLAYIKANINQLATLDQEEADQVGPFDVGMAADDGTAKVIWVASGVFFNDNTFQVTEGANASFLSGLLAWLTPLPGRQDFAVKSMLSTALSYNQTAFIVIGALWIIIPVTLLVVAAVKAVRRRRA